MIKSVRYGLCLCFCILLTLAFQNCAPKSQEEQNYSEASNEGLADQCTNSSLVGIWTSNPSNPTDPTSETLTVSDKCLASSKLCGGVTSFSNIPSYGGTAIKGPITVKVSGSNQSAGCLQNGSYDCTFGLGPSTTGDVFSLQCNGQNSFLFYRQSAAAATLTSKYIYVSNRGLTSKFTIAQADALCLSDSAKPQRVRSAKAMVADGFSRRACTTGYCTGGTSESKDWVLSPKTTYIDTKGDVIGETNESGLLRFPLQKAIGQVGQSVWIGFSSSWNMAPDTCQGWTNDSSSFGWAARIGEKVPISNSNPWGWEWGQIYCGASLQIICVEQ